MTNEQALKEFCDRCIYNKYAVTYIPGGTYCKAIQKECHCKAYMKLEKLIKKKEKEKRK